MKPIHRLIVAIFLSQSSLVHADDYVLGHGYNVGLWNISGYTSIEMNLPNRQAANFTVDDFAIFVHGRINRYVNPFVEGEYSNQSLWTEGDGVLSSGAGHFVLERLYNDILFTDALLLRFGKMLAPVGEWNQIHAAPLVATTIRPLTTYLNFSEFVTGISLNYAAEQSSLLPSVSVYYQPDEEFLPKPLTSRPYHYKNLSGFQLVYAHDLDWRAAFSMQHAELVNRNERQTLFSWDGRYDFDIFSFETQASYNQIYGNQHRQRNNEWGGYLQLSVPVMEDWSLVGRGETFTARDAKTSQQNAVFGVNYRPNAALVWKLEYLLVKGATGTPLNEGIYTSFGVMF